ncbi:uncharacterized protein N7529_000953, partial [Penicillium soppii]|uniref:uncharacterized protein n=1 Tax=Penicillium soppii TaxID=69789 RepID=UPI0025470C88
VDLKEFPKLRDLQSRDSSDIDSARIESGGKKAVEGVASSVDTSANEAINGATSAVSSMIHAQVHDLKSHLPRYYFVGLWGYCKSQDSSEMVCSDPSTSFAFDLSALLDSTPVKVSDMIPDIDQSSISSYRPLSLSLTRLYISGFVATTLTIILAGRKFFFSNGSKLLAIFCTLSSTLITTATTLVMVLYGLFASVVKNNLQTYGVQVNFGANMLITTWLALMFSIASSIIWLVQIFCCCI